MDTFEPGRKKKRKKRVRRVGIVEGLSHELGDRGVTNDGCLDLWDLLPGWGEDNFLSHNLV